MDIFIIFVIIVVCFSCGVLARKQNGYQDEPTIIEKTIRRIRGKARGVTIGQNIYRNRNGQKMKVGEIISCQKNGAVKIGFSLCNKEDAYDAKGGYILASQRMSETTLTMPHSIGKDIDKFIDRCYRYYRGAKAYPKRDGVTITNP